MSDSPILSTITLSIADFRKIIKSACVSAHYLAKPDDIPEWSSEQYRAIADKYVIVAQIYAEFRAESKAIQKPARKKAGR
jgi:hypothetical protein